MSTSLLSNPFINNPYNKIIETNSEDETEALKKLLRADSLYINDCDNFTITQKQENPEMVNGMIMPPKYSYDINFGDGRTSISADRVNVVKEVWIGTQKANDAQKISDFLKVLQRLFGADELNVNKIKANINAKIEGCREEVNKLLGLGVKKEERKALNDAAQYYCGKISVYKEMLEALETFE